MKLLLVLNKYLPAQVAGTEVYVHNLAKYMSANGQQVKVIIPNYGKSDSNTYLHDGIEVIQFAEPTRLTKRIMMGLDAPLGLAYFSELLQKEQPDLVHFHEISGSNGITVYHVQAAKQLGFPTILTFHLAGNTCRTGSLKFLDREDCDGKIDVFKCASCTIQQYTRSSAATIISPISKMLYQLGFNAGKTNTRIGTALSVPFQIKALRERFEILVRSTDKFITLTHWYKNILLANNVAQAQIDIVPQSLPFFDIPPKKIKQQDNLLVRFVFAGRISSFKGIQLMLDAFEQLKDKPATLDIYGQDDGSAYAAECFERMSTMPNVQYKGVIENNLIQEVLGDYDALILASTFSEMSPLVIQQAFAAGIPVIASDVYGNKEQVTHQKNGLLFRFNDAASLKQQLERCVTENDLLKKLASNISAPVSFNETGNAYLHIYRQVVPAETTEVKA